MAIGVISGVGRRPILRPTTMSVVKVEVRLSNNILRRYVVDLATNGLFRLPTPAATDILSLSFF